MKKIDIDLINKYVNSDDLDELTIEQLEDDKNFMMEVIRYTNDFRIYNLCSDNVKKDYDFVKGLILKFKDNLEFIIKVADYYLDNTDTDFERRELSIIMSKFLPDELSSKYKLLNETAYYAKRFDIEMAKAQDPKVESMVGMGFLLMFDSYNSSDVILDYYAKSMINEIIKDNNINFETMLHNQFKSADKLDEVGINNYIIQFIGYYDSMLSAYISTHLDLIDNMANEIKEIRINWDRYNTTVETERYNNMLNMVHEYMQISESHMSETDILYFVAKELGIKDKVEHHDNAYPMDEELIDDIVKFELERSLKERIVYSNVRKIMINQLFSSNPTDLYSIINTGSETSFKRKLKCKIIEFKPNDGNNN